VITVVSPCCLLGLRPLGICDKIAIRATSAAGFVVEVNTTDIHFYWPRLLDRGYAVAQLVEALRYKPEGRGFDSRWSHWNFPVT
jgi:hypothetical protein